MVFNGRRYNRYPNAERRHLRLYYIRTGGESLHRAVWAFHNGPIPDGMHVHHKDGDTLNNDIANLELVTPGEHLRAHGADERRRSNQQLDHLAKIRELAKGWHSSPEGREWHSNNLRSMRARGLAGVPFSKAASIKKCCVVCGSEFETKSKASKYCSVACERVVQYKKKAELVVANAYSRANAPQVCQHCGVVYTAVRKRMYCSERCGNAAFHARRGVVKRGTKFSCICAVCGSTFEASRPTTDTCSQACYIKRWREEKRKAAGVQLDRSRES